ncbi:aspartyl protease family protein [Paraburkholderia flava]|uniref:aspartyl protease family protein n=1 Tax=Paraburkholderia flava TaxID=2547393 RepID=UPI0014152550|nr:aspartyl protease family protein [Paraburkholderia flava]
MAKRLEFLRDVSLAGIMWICCSPFASAQMVETHPDPSCQLTKNAQVQMTVRSGHYVIPVEIGGHVYPMVLGIGSDRTAFTPEAIQTLGLAEDSRRASVVAGLGTGSTSEYPRILPSLRFGGSEWVDLPVLPMQSIPDGPPGAGERPVGLLGADVLSRFDLDVDFVNRSMSLYTAQGCVGQFLPWQGRYFEYATRPVPGSRHRFVIPVQLNGVSLNALLSTGTARSALKREDQPNVGGVSTGSPNKNIPNGASGYAGSGAVVDRYRFESFRIGPATYHNVLLRVSDTVPEGEDIALGLDFMHSRRIWFPRSSEQVFMQPSTDRRDVPIPSEIIQPGTSGSIPDGDDPESLDAMIRSRPELSTHSHMTYYPNVRVIQRARLQPPP